MSRAVGRIEEAVASLKTTQDAQWRKLDKIDNYIVTHKAWMIGMASTISLITTMVVYYLKSKIFGE